MVGSRVPELSTLLDPAGREFLKDPIGCMMLTPQEFGEVCEKNRRIKPYMDVVLQNDTEKYQTFVHDLYLRSMLQFTSRPKDMACPFFVNKKNGRQRLVMDCRAINQRFRAPPLLKMAAGSSWSHVEIPAGKSLYIISCRAASWLGVQLEATDAEAPLEAYMPFRAETTSLAFETTLLFWHLRLLCDMLAPRTCGLDMRKGRGKRSRGRPPSPKKVPGGSPGRWAEFS